MILIHYSQQPFPDLVTKRLIPDNRHSPGGLWLTDESANRSWKHVVSCGAKSDPVEWLKFAQSTCYKTYFQIISQELVNVKHIKNRDELLQFTQDYGDLEPRACHPEQKPGLHIQWEQVRQDYKGILIIPYLASMSHRACKPETHWYRFDCASGCIWDTSCLRQLTPSQPIDPYKEFDLPTPEPGEQG